MGMFMNERELFEVTYLQLCISLRAQESARLPKHLGSALRGVLGQVLYRTDRKLYEFLYENGKECKDQQDIVKPYVIIPPAVCGTELVVQKGEELKFEILLFGKGVKCVALLIDSLQKMKRLVIGAQRYPFYLLRIIDTLEQRILWQEDRDFIRAICTKKLLHLKLEGVTGAVVQLQTPLRIRRGGKLLTHISFETLIRNITKRIVMLVERYGGWVDYEEVKNIQILAAKVQTVKEEVEVEFLERYSNRLHGKMDFSGLIGELEYAGDLTPFVPWLAAAQVLHIGRNTTFGMGKVQVYFI